VVDSGDEYIELYNPEDVPISLFGWRLEDRSLLPAAEEEDAARRIFTFGRDALIGPRGYLLLWGKESRISLNNSFEQISLYNPAGELVDRIEWERHPGADR
ncbi:lamin tail domain-containing protein, partial [Arthrospira platensis SPKY2]